jgi:glycosyl hydrolase family 59 (putative galactocerebrosidase)
MKHLRLFLGINLFFMLGIVVMASESNLKAKAVNWTFEKTEVGKVPRGWVITDTKGKNTPATWKIVEMKDAPSGKQAFVLTETKNERKTYNLAIASKTSYKDLQITLKVKSLTGEVDQGGGPIWRAKDKDNYYIARWNPLETNFRVYHVKDKKRTQIATVEDIKTDNSKWHDINIVMIGNKITASFDGKKIIEVKDDTFTEAGMVGLWTKADAVTAFDDLKVHTAK